MLRLLTPLAFCLLPLLVACKANKAVSTTAPMADPTDTLYVAAGEPFVIELPSLLGAGYEWRLVAAPTATPAPDSISTYRPPTEDGQPPEPGPEGMLERFHFGGQPAGRLEFRFEQVRPWRVEVVRDSLRRVVVVE